MQLRCFFEHSQDEMISCRPFNSNNLKLSMVERYIAYEVVCKKKCKSYNHNGRSVRCRSVFTRPCGFIKSFRPSHSIPHVRAPNQAPSRAQNVCPCESVLPLRRWLSLKWWRRRWRRRAAAVRRPLLGDWECPVRQWAGDCAAICREGRPIERGRPGPGLLTHVLPLRDASIACRATG